MVYSILSEALVQPSVAPAQPVVTQYQVVWDENSNLKGWTTFVNMDVVGTWGGFLFGTKRSKEGGFIGPSSSFPAVDALVNDTITFRMKYDKGPNNPNPTSFGKIQWTTLSDPLFGDNKSVTFDLVADGSWVLYELNMAEVSSWVGEVDQIRFFPCEDGFFNDEFFLAFFEIGTNEFDFALELEAAGTPGFVEGSIPLNQAITIQKDMNDKLIVNIDGYGDVQITLTPQTAQPFLICRDIALQLGKVSIGGYTRAKCFLTDDSRLRIESGTLASDSSVSIKGGTTSAAEDLGLTDTVGSFIGISGGGSNPDPTYSPLSAYIPTTLEILALFDNDDDLPAFGLDPTQPIVQAGNINFATVNQELEQTVLEEGRNTGLQGFTINRVDALDGTGKTFIDLNHPFSDSGKVDKIYMNGVPDISGNSKWKIFRPRFDGNLDLVSEGVIGEQTFTNDPNGGIVASPVPDIFVADVSSSNVQVRRGDLLGIYNVELNAGSGSALKPDALYYELDGDATGSITPPQPSGAGERGLAIYAQSATFKTRAVVDVDLRRRLNLDTIKIIGEEDSRDLEYNIGVASSAVYSSDGGGGNHTICYNPSPFLRVCFERANIGFNVQALNDGIRLPENGLAGFGDGGPSGLGGADVSGASYFYFNGDGEFLDVYEFVDQSPAKFDFFRDPIGLECFVSNQTPRVSKDIGKLVMYFKEKKNQRSWQLEYFTGGKGGNASKPGFQIIPGDSINSVKTDDKEITRATLVQSKGLTADLLVDNPVVLDVVAADGTINPQRGEDFDENAGELGGVNVREQVTFLDFQWNRFEWNFDSVRTPGIRWACDYHWSTKIAEMEIYAVSSVQESLGDNVQIFFSDDGSSFTSADVINATEKEASYKLGNSPQYLRLVFRPTLNTSINDVKIEFEDDQVCFGPEGRIIGSTSLVEARVGSFGASNPLLITNDTGQTADLIVDLPEDIESSRQLLYFNKLHSADDIKTPQVGPPGRVDFVPDKVLNEETNVAINAKAYGLLNLVSGTENFLSDDLAVNGDFESGDLTGWSLEIAQSGSLPFQIPRVDDFSDSSTGFIQEGDFSFGVNMDLDDPSQDEQFEPIALKIGQTHDLTDFASSIDQGASSFEFSIRYVHYGEGSNPVVRVIGAPTLSGALASPGTIVDSSYGSNLLSEVSARVSSSLGSPDPNGQIDYAAQVDLKSGTRFVRSEIDVNITGEQSNFTNTIKRLIFMMDDYEAFVRTPAITAVNWYKSFLTGQNDFTDASFVAVPPEFITVTTGSNHWWQPISQSATTSPVAGQTQGFSQAFTQERDEGVQSFARMISTDPGLLGIQWAGERTVAGIRIAHAENTAAANFADHYPRFWHIEVLKTQSELGGVAPDINNNTHFKIVRKVTELVREGPPQQLSVSASAYGGAQSKITTWLFDDPVTTEGVRIVYTLNCDTFERSAYPDFASFNSVTGCPDNQSFTTDFLSNKGIVVSMFQALESLGRTTLPIDNIPDRTLTPGVALLDGSGGTVHAAVDLGRHFDLDTDSDLFELISQSLLQSNWPTNAVFSDDSTSDPNSVTWDGSASFARWVRFTTPAEPKSEWEKQKIEITGGTPSDSGSPYSIAELPQAILTQARIYPKIQTDLIPTEGRNHFWAGLGTVLSDNLHTTFIYYSDYPVVALDLGRPYTLKQTSAATVLRRDLVTGNPNSIADDKQYWDREDDQGFAYSYKALSSVSDPSKVQFTNYGTATPTTAVRWVAVRGLHNLLQDGLSNTPKEYNFRTPGQTLYEVKLAPESPEPFTENSNWFSTRTAALRDVSTFDLTAGNLFSIQEGVDYGSNGSVGQIGTFGDPYFVWDGKFDIADDDFWGIALRDPNTGLDLVGNDFPHYVWRVFRDPYRGAIEQKSVRAVLIVGYNEEYYPTDFKLQSFDDPEADPDLDSSWTDIDEGSFSSVDTFNEGFGFTAIFPEAVGTYGIRLHITDSVYADDTVTQDVNELGQFNQNPLDRGPQTRLVSVTALEEVEEAALLEGNLEVNHALGSNVTAVSGTSEHPSAHLVDNDLRTYYQSTGFTDSITFALGSSQTVDRIEWEMNSNFGQQTGGASTNAPSTFRVKANPGGVFSTILEESDFIGLTYSGILASPITADTFVMEVDSVQGQTVEGASSIIMHEFRLIEEVTQTEPLVTIEDVADRRPGGTNQRSTKIIYAKDTSAVTSVVLDGIDGNNDEHFSERDFFSFWIHINDISRLDTDFGFFRLGNSRTTFYAWEISTANLASGWNEVKLQFSQAYDRSVIPFQPGSQFDPDTGESQVDFVTADAVITSSVDGNFSRRIEEGSGIRFFGMEFRGTGSSQNLEMVVDDMQFVRNRFDDVCRFAPSLYLNNSETFAIHLEGLDLATGTVEFWMQPDWDEAGRIDRLRNFLPGIFKVLRPDGGYLTFFYRPAVGFVALINDRDEIIQFETEVSKYNFDRYDTFHVALVWDALARIQPWRSSIILYINGEPVYGHNRKWDSLREGGASVMFGGEVSQTVASTPHNATALTFTPVPTLPQSNTSSTWALLENIKIYNYAKTDFSDRDQPNLSRTQLVKPSDMLQISLDDVNFHSSGSDGLPLVVQDVPAGGSATIYMRSNIPKDLTGDENRDATLLVRWKTPLVQCD